MAKKSSGNRLSVGLFGSTLAKIVVVIGLMSIFLAGLMIPIVGTAGLTARAATDTFNDMPVDFKITPPSEQSTLLASDGSVIAHFFTEERIVVDISDMSEWVQKAIVDIEDRRFYQHSGVDLEGILRALVNNIVGNKTQGASTLTQQFVKNTLLEQGIRAGDEELINRATSRSIGRKLREAKYALSLENNWSKEQILAGYLNVAPFGANIYGIEAASQHYFSKHAKDLNLAESALLAGITQAPTAFNPITNPEGAQQRRNQVLDAMLSTGDITKKQHDDAEKLPVKDMLKVSNQSQGCMTAGTAAYFCSYVVEELMHSNILGETYSERRSALLRGGFKIYTSLDPAKQKAAQESIESYVPINDPSNVRASLVSIETSTGNIVAMAQNTHFGFPSDSDPSATQNSFNADSKHGGSIGFQPGSSFKPIALAVWFDKGHSAYESVGGRYSYAASDFHSSCPDKAIPSNFSFKNAVSNVGRTSVYLGTQESYNSTYVAMLSKLDMCDVRQMAINLGAVQGDGKMGDFYPSSVLGAGSVPPLYMANVYAAFVHSGEQCKPRVITALEDRNGKKIRIPPPSCKRVMDESSAQKVSTVLKNNYRHYGGAQMGRQAIAKTGTTDSAANTWFLGATPQYATAVWLGHENSFEPLENITINGRYYATVWGMTIPAQIWGAYYRQGMDGVPKESIPDVNIR